MSAFFIPIFFGLKRMIAEKKRGMIKITRKEMLKTDKIGVK